MKNHKAPNGDMMVGEIFKYAAPKVCLEILHQILVEIWNTAQIPTSMGKAIMITLFKKGDSHLCTNYRGITLLSHCLKVISRIINDRLMWYFKEHCFFPESQYGFREKRSTVDMVISLRMIQSAWKEKISLYTFALIDIAKAYNSVKRELLWKLLERNGIPPKPLRLIQAAYEAIRCSVRFNDFESDFFQIIQGVLQGDISSPTLFNVFFGFIIKMIHDTLGEMGIKLRFRLDGSLFDLRRLKAKSKIFWSYCLLLLLLFVLKIKKKCK